ncbi:MAG TPA: hypothetical protein VKU83_11820 [Puia sp.]|nr:hypothetical protein [Puia sp.]
MADYIPDIRSLLPQGPPFIMVDRFLGSDGIVTRTSFLVTPGNPLVEKGRFSAGGLIENLAQTAAAGAGWETMARAGEVVGKTAAGPRSGAVVSIDRLEIHDLPAVGKELFTETSVTTRVGDIIVISGKISCGQSVIAVGEMKILAGV